MQILQTVFAGCGAIIGSFLTALYVFQEKILYHPNIPSRTYDRTPASFGLDYTDIDILTEDDVKLHAWLITQPNPKDAATFLYFHGNAGNISHRLPDARFYHASGFNVLMVSYRGYGQSDGTPSERGIRRDASAALEYICDRNDTIDKDRLYVFGRSIGAACAISLAASEQGQNTVRGVVVENTFTSIDDMIDVVLPFLKFAKPFNRNKWNSMREIPNIKRGVAIPLTPNVYFGLSGLRDELVPPSHMTKLREAASKAPFTSLYTVEGGGHNDTWWVGGQRYRMAIREFIDRVERREY